MELLEFGRLKPVGVVGSVGYTTLIPNVVTYNEMRR